MKKNKVNYQFVMGVLLLVFLWAQPAFAKTTDSLYTEIDGNGTVIDGNVGELDYDKPVIRPTYMGKAIKEDVIGPDGPFLGFYDETPGGWGEGYYGHQYRIGTNAIMRNLGTYKGREIALKMGFTRPSGHWAAKVNLERDGAVRFDMDYENPAEIQLVYNDGVFNTPVKDVYVELPLLYRPTSYNNSKLTYDISYVKTSNLQRLYFTTLNYNNISNIVSREMHRFRDTSAKYYQAEALKMIHDNRFSGNGMLKESVGMTFVFDNNEPLVFYGKGVTSPASYATFFKSELKTPGEIRYLPPKSKAVKNTDKFEAQFDVTQPLNDGYSQYFPDYLSVVMSDRQKKFSSLHLGEALFTDQRGTDISKYVEIVPINDHELAFRVKKKDLITLGSNQLNMTFSADGLDSKEVMKDFDQEEGVYRVPMTFYNYKSQNGQKISSDELVTVANIIPNIYGEAADDVKASQYTTSGELDKARLLKNVATTLPGDELTTEIIDPAIQFDEVKTYQVEVRVKSKTTQREKVISVPVSVTEAVVVTSEYFEDQEWLINEVNRQLAPKKIDQDLYLSDLLKIKSIIDRDPALKYTGQHIPKTINALKNLEWLELWNKGMLGRLPDELGELTHLHHLTIYGNKFNGSSLPESLGNLRELSVMQLYANSLSGRIPETLTKLTKLRAINVSYNQLIGSIPRFPDNQLELYDVSYSQVTFNDNQTPTFIPRPDDYGRTLIVKNHAGTENHFIEWALNGRERLPVVVDKTRIKPFDSANIGFFNLHVKSRSNLSTLALFPDHTYQVTSQKTGKVVYEGIADKAVELVVDVGESFEIIMDGADKNPNNRFVIKGTPRELAFIDTPKQLSLSLATDNLAMQSAELSETEGLKVRDNRLGGNWQLKLLPSELTSQGRVLRGGYTYLNEGNQSVDVPVGQYKVIEQGKSDPNTEFIDISNRWNKQRGLHYQVFQINNYKGNYQGKVEWQLVDAPVIP